jgi:hypothetical protein
MRVFWGFTRTSAGITGVTPIRVRQVGRTFSSAKQLDAWAEANGKEVLSKSGASWKKYVSEAIEDANDQAAEEGYRDWEDWDRKNKNPDHVREVVAENRERLAKEQGHVNIDHDSFSPTTGKLPQGKLKVALNDVSS